MAFALDNVKHFLEKPGIYVASQARRERVEVRLRDLTKDQLKLFSQAKHKEITEWLKHETIEVIKREHPSVNRDLLMKMRWVLTWMDDGSAKARLVVLGITHPRLLEQKTESPTPCS